MTLKAGVSLTPTEKSVPATTEEVRRKSLPQSEEALLPGNLHQAIEHPGVGQLAG